MGLDFLPHKNFPTLAAAFVVILFGTLSGCRESLPDPTEAQVEIRFLSAESGLAEGAEVFLDGNRIRASLSEETIDTLLTAGEHTIVFRKTCVAVEPSETLTIQVDAGGAQQVDFHLAPASNVLVVDSDIEGAAISLNGVPTGRTTPSSFVCMEPGRYQVGLDGAAVDRLRVRPRIGRHPADGRRAGPGEGRCVLCLLLCPAGATTRRPVRDLYGHPLPELPEGGRGRRSNRDGSGLR